MGIKQRIGHHFEFNFLTKTRSFLGALLGIGLIGYIQQFQFSSLESTFLIGSFGATAVIIYGMPNSEYAKGRNVIGGHVISALIGVTFAKLIPDANSNWIACSLSVAMAIVAMQFTKTTHPPGGATALIANIGTAKIKALGYFYVVNPVLIGCVILLSVAYVVNRLCKQYKDFN